ncbi:MAG: hypothetical protein IPN93_02990 [Bacteroidetes bacterium]|nr:hypothetical protein [Bacteroidota bacterium]
MTFEKEIKLGTDAREPRFCVYKDTLRFLFFESGSSLTKFEPHNIWNAETVGDGKWSALVDVNLPGFVPWRMRINNDTLLYQLIMVLIYTSLAIKEICDFSKVLMQKIGHQ